MTGVAEIVAHVLAALLGIAAALSGLSFWIVGLAPGPSKPWKQTSLGAACLTVAVYLLVYAFTGSLPY